MSLLELRARNDVVIVEKKSKGKYPGKISPKKTLGMVYTSWTSNEYKTIKMSILDVDGNITFTSNHCVINVGEVKDFPELALAYKKYADTHFIPVFVSNYALTEKDFPEAKDSKEIFSKLSTIRIKFLSKENYLFAPKTAVHPEDLVLLSKQNKSIDFHCIRMEEWYLKRYNIL